MNKRITIPDTEFFDEEKNEFIYIKGRTLTFSHSLISISKWEAKWHKPYLEKSVEKTDEEMVDYIRCMCLDRDVEDNPYILLGLSEKNIEELNAYINNPMTASTIKNVNKPNVNKKIITSEYLYYMMIALQIPLECAKWHINRLLMLIEICQIENEGPKKMSKAETLAKQRELNQKRRAMAKNNKL